MHEPLLGDLEEYLQGGCSISSRLQFEQHLAECESCRSEVSQMINQAILLRSLSVSRELEPDPGFYARVMNRIEAQVKVSPWGLFSESLFAKRLAYASITFLVLMGTYFLSTTQPLEPIGSPESLMATESTAPPPDTSGGQTQEKSRNAILVNLATFQSN